MSVAIEEDQVTQSRAKRPVDELASRGLVRGLRPGDDLADRGQWEFSRIGWLYIARKQLDAIEDLPRGWDSHGADSPNPAIVEAARTLLRCLRSGGDFPKPHINPTPTGGVQFEWVSDSLYLEVDVDDDVHATFFFQDRNAGIEDEGEIFYEGSLDEVVGHLNEMYPG